MSNCNCTVHVCKFYSYPKFIQVEFKFLITDILSILFLLLYTLSTLFLLPDTLSTLFLLPDTLSTLFLSLVTLFTLFHLLDTLSTIFLVILDDCLSYVIFFLVSNVDLDNLNVDHNT